MSVNTMSFEDAAAILNNIRKQVTGETAAAPMDVSSFISLLTSSAKQEIPPVNPVYHLFIFNYHHFIYTNYSLNLKQ